MNSTLKMSWDSALVFLTLLDICVMPQNAWCLFLSKPTSQLVLLLFCPPPPMYGCKVLQSDCLYANLSVCFLFACLCACTSRTRHVQISPNFFYTCYMCLLLGPPLTTMRYMYFQFCGWRHVFYNEWNMQNQRRRICFVQFSRWRHW